MPWNMFCISKLFSLSYSFLIETSIVETILRSFSSTNTLMRISTHFHSLRNYSKPLPSLQFSSHLVANFSNWSQKFPMNASLFIVFSSSTIIVPEQSLVHFLFEYKLFPGPEVLPSSKRESTIHPIYTPKWIRMEKPLRRRNADESE